MESTQKTKDYPDHQMVLKKSNALISAKYRASLLQNKIMAIALTRIEVENENGEQTVCARLYPGEIKELIKKDDTNIYKKLKSVARTMTGHSIVVEDGNGNFTAFALITQVTYENKVLEIRFHENLLPHITNLKMNYTTLSLSTLTGVDKNASFRIYELLQKEIYRSKPDIDHGKVSVTYVLSEFKFMIGLANAEETAVQRALANTKSNIDWDYLYEHTVVEKSYSDWSDLKKRILLPAQKELAEKSNLRFEFEGIRIGGPKVRKIKFDIYPNTPTTVAQQKINERARIMEQKDTNYQYSFADLAYPELYRDYLGHNMLEKEDIQLLLKKANFDEQKVRDAITLADQQPEISNYMGWIIRCIERDGYPEPISTVNGSHERAQNIQKIKSESHAPSTSERVWLKIKQRPDYKDFLESMGCSEDTIEIVYDDCRERVELYTDWKVGQNQLV